MSMRTFLRCLNLLRPSHPRCQRSSPIRLHRSLLRIDLNLHRVDLSLHHDPLPLWRPLQWRRQRLRSPPCQRHGSTLSRRSVKSGDLSLLAIPLPKDPIVVEKGGAERVEEVAVETVVAESGRAVEARGAGNRGAGGAEEARQVSPPPLPPIESPLLSLRRPLLLQPRKSRISLLPVQCSRRAQLEPENTCFACANAKQLELV